MIFKTMIDGSIACGPNDVLNLYNDTITKQMNLNNSAKFKEVSYVEVIATVDELKAYYMSCGETDINAKNHAFIILANKIGLVLGAVKCTEGMFYNIEFETEPFAFLPEKFLERR